MIRNKTIKFNLDKPDERELWELLQQLPHGSFSEMTKQFWRTQIKIAEKENSPETQWRKEMSEKLLLHENPWIAEMRKEKRDDEAPPNSE